MGLLDVFKKKGASKKASLPSNPNPASIIGGAYEIIIALWGEDTYKKAITTFKEVISGLVTEEEVHRKTELLESGLDMCLELLEQGKRNPQTKLGANTITAFIYFRIFLDCTLAIDTDIIAVTKWYTIFRVTKTIRPGMHPYVEMMIRIYDLLDRGIEYLYKNMDSVTEDYFLPVEKRIRRMLNAYTDDNTGWNKINPQA